ncbi:Cytochrome P450 [Macleaya cordata]|uniref:Cytochrome P450 n=1 Tax=Macleaya cordata TaxID=56857 RepID=A0A200QXE6_MACCD|nr:Cytochrome P450 [Macleaya cordata]
MIWSNVVSVAKEGWSWWWEDGGSCDSTKDKVAGIVVLVSMLVAVFVTSWYILRTRRSMELPLPSGPRGLPLVGNLLSLETDFYIYFTKLAQVYGPIMKLQLGSKVCVVLSSSSLAKEALKDHDVIFANRDPSIAALVSSYSGLDIGLSPINSEWRKLRKLFPS